MKKTVVALGLFVLVLMLLPTALAEPVVKNWIRFSSETAFTLRVNSPGWTDHGGYIRPYYDTPGSDGAPWHGEKLTAGQPEPGSEYVLYLRGENIKYISLYEYQCFILEHTVEGDKTPIYCEGDIRSLLDYRDVSNTTMANGCFAYLFYNCTLLATAPELPATTLAANCYDGMFSGSNIAISDKQGDGYYLPWRIPSAGEVETLPDVWNTDMLKDTTGPFTGDPVANFTYYQKGGTPPVTPTPSAPSSNTPPRTGDGFPLMGACAMLVASALAGLLLGKRARRDEHFVAFCKTPKTPATLHGFRAFLVDKPLTSSYNRYVGKPCLFVVFPCGGHREGFQNENR